MCSSDMIFVMVKKTPILYKVLGFSHWQDHSSFWKCKCICGKIFSIDKKRMKGDKAYKSCGCIKDCNSKTYYHAYRRSMILNTYKEGDCWIYKSNSKQKIVKLTFRKNGYSIQRLAYMFWHHLSSLDRNIVINTICGNKFCVKPSHLRELNCSEANKLWWSKKNGKNN